MIQGIGIGIVVAVVAVWIAGYRIDRTVRTPIDALDAIIEWIIYR